MTTTITAGRIGQLAKDYCGKRLPLQVLRTVRGYYIGTADDDGPCSRESLEYFPSEHLAQHALDSNEWTQRDEP